jgi:hypothetical protein
MGSNVYPINPKAAELAWAYDEAWKMIDEESRIRLRGVGVEPGPRDAYLDFLHAFIVALRRTIKEENKNLP